MTAALTARQRKTFTALAAVALPGASGQPPASDVDIAGELLDRVIASRPDITDELVAILDSFDGEADDFLRSLPDDRFTVLMTTLCGAYLMDRRVMRALDYSGQQPLTLDRGGFGGEELVMELMEQPKRYRPV